MRDEEKEESIQITIKKEWCKGCSICVDICPEHVLAMGKGVAEVVNIEACTTCKLCEMHCPDFAVVVTGKRAKKKVA